MPFNLNEDRRLKTTWFEYDKTIRDLNRRKYYIVKDMLKNKEVSSLEEAENVFKQKIIKMEDERRKEMKEVQKKVRAEKKIEMEQHKDMLSAKREALRLKREKNKAEQLNVPVRRSRRLAKKNSSSPSSV